MYCPKCSQQQPSPEQRYCSRCGFLLVDVALLLENDGLMANVPHPVEAAGRRGRAIKEGLLLTLASWLVALLATSMFDWGGAPEMVSKVGALIFFLLGLVGLLRFVYAFLFVRDPAAAPAAPTLRAPTRQAALPSPRENPLTDYPRRTNTREMQPRDSVTDQTTRLLDDN